MFIQGKGQLIRNKKQLPKPSKSLTLLTMPNYKRI